MANVQDLDEILANAVENLVGVPADEHHTYVRVVCLISAIRIFAKQLHRLADARRTLRAPLGERSCK
jgi:hypothetical protein